MNDQAQPPSPDPGAPDPGQQSAPAASRRRWRPRRDPGTTGAGGSPSRRGAALTAATSRTAGWMVAAALAGSLVTLLLVGRNAPVAVVPVGRTVFAGPGGGQFVAPGGGQVVAPGGGATRSWTSIGGPMQGRLPGRRSFVVGPAPGRAYFGQVPAMAPRWIQIHGNREIIFVPGPAGFPGPGMGMGPGMVPACPQAWAGRAVIKGVIVAPGRHTVNFRQIRPRAFRSVVIGPGRRATRMYFAAPGGAPRQAIFWAAGPGGRARQVTVLPGPGGPGAVVMGPGGAVIAGLPGAPGCAAFRPVPIHLRPARGTG